MVDSNGRELGQACFRVTVFRVSGTGADKGKSHNSTLRCRKRDQGKESKDFEVQNQEKGIVEQQKSPFCLASRWIHQFLLAEAGQSCKGERFIWFTVLEMQ